jgi:hypothetical protein
MKAVICDACGKTIADTVNARPPYTVIESTGREFDICSNACLSSLSEREKRRAEDLHEAFKWSRQ